MVNTRFLTIYDNNTNNNNEASNFTSTTTTKTANFRLKNDPILNDELTENRKTFRANHHVNFKEPIHGTRTILKVKTTPHDPMKMLEKNSIQKHEINSFSRSLSSYNINNIVVPRHTDRRYHGDAYSNMSSNPYAVKLPINRMDLNNFKKDDIKNQSRFESRSEIEPLKSNSSNKFNKTPTIQLDLEINTPRNDIKISRKCKSYEVRV